MTTDPTSADGTADGTLHNVPDGLLDGRAPSAPPTAETPFVPPYAEHVEPAPEAATLAAGFAFADVSAEPVAPPGTAAPGPVAGPPTLAAARPETSTMADRARRWGAPLALVAAGLVGGFTVTGVLTNASASTPADSSSVSDAGTRGTRDTAPATRDGDDGGLTVDELDGSAEGDGGHGGRARPGDVQGSGARSVSDGFTLAPQGTTGASG